MALLNLGILAHVDAGKTSLTERLLHLAGVRTELGSVDAGSTLTDSMELERQRGITIRSAVASFMIGDTQVNLLDTPGHPDFIAEVERVLGVLDGAVLVVSAVEGVQAQTRILMRALRRLDLPLLLFVNKIDRTGANPERVLRDVMDRLTPDVVPMGYVSQPGGPQARFQPYGPDDEFRTRLVDVLATHDEGIIAAYVADDSALPYALLRKELGKQIARCQVFPVFFGSAITGQGADVLMSAIAELLPGLDGDADGDLSATVFKIDREASGEKVAYVRVFSGTVHVRSRVDFGRGRGGKVTGIVLFTNGATERSATLGPGQIGKLWGLADIRIGDTIGTRNGHGTDQRQFAPPTLETVIVPRVSAAKGTLNAALRLLAEQDPLINLRQDDIRQETYVSLYGEVQKEVIQATLAGDFGVDVDFRETTTICVERPVGTGEAVEVLRVGDNPYLATVGLRVERGPLGSGVTFRLGVELGSMPLAFFRAVEEAVQGTLRQGLHGWEVIDCAVTLHRSGYLARQSHSHGSFDKSMSSTATDFRYLTPLVLMAALRQAGTTVHEPLHWFRLEMPTDLYTSMLQVLTKYGAVPQVPTIGGELSTVEGEIPAASIHALQQQLPSLTRGEGVLESAFERWEQVVGTPPERPRTDINPLERARYLLAMRR
ncbi:MULTISPECIES: translation factor GTPase family protein [unclassified Micromonospora]|uniref:elongation factor G n=1 Tax=unclassified Micromonospora TaxID=2617518 RepID=UPI0009D321CB|nr:MULTISPECIES: TetM/TetW/TetO/TetS family tetracycline resistance ribosomal protection protein [unclassified Micromonospora]MDI5936659.1 TetM/TetW/TetO/TetS family tetracycline resistance ribosomal protection protein [Micromonospora sp. DH15]OON32462.1 GTP-binding protein [Micromonospora sp. Rc5]